MQLRGLYKSSVSFSGGQRGDRVACEFGTSAVQIRAGEPSNPFFLRPHSDDEGGDHRIGSVVDSQELFSVAWIETEWTGHGGRRKNQNSSMSSKKSGENSDDVLDGESELFEIVLPT
ncbi:hypothetical protein MA16_Dca025639 [Dendrobium catenatum]|uniref:Uncharacterized protein n=1 Tax=Dendrobium catenatum TaxID=906689 RepID=A0A2I0WKE4_9ASPA|nr:hypothetical protein MA16_Dca025639 [Dendrobium catenatum]